MGDDSGTVWNAIEAARSALASGRVFVAKGILLELVGASPSSAEAWHLLAEIADLQRDRDREAYCRAMAEKVQQGLPVEQPPADGPLTAEEREERDGDGEYEDGGGRVGPRPRLDQIEGDREPDEGLGRPERFGDG